MEVNCDSYQSLLKDCIVLCYAVLDSDASAELKDVAQNRLSVLRITVDMNARFCSFQERNAWQQLQNMIKG